MGENAQAVFLFSEGNASMKELLGGKGANLAEMTRLGLPVPPGFCITTAACNRFYREGRRTWPALESEIGEALARLEKQAARRFGGRPPLLLSVRSGAAISMPGMMDTILNLGLNDVTVEGLAVQLADRRFAFDCYRRFIQMFAGVVLKIDRSHFDDILAKKQAPFGARDDTALTASDIEAVVEAFKEVVQRETGHPFPADPWTQLLLSIQAVFDSWHTPRAEVYREVHRIPENLGTAVNVQVMVFGNLGRNSGTGVAFTRNPSTGEASLYGEYLLNAQGEDVVAGTSTPKPLAELSDDMPEVYVQFQKTCRILEQHYRDMQDIEFTIEQGKLYLLQTRTGKRTVAAAIKIAVDLVSEGLITREEALLRLDPLQLEQLLHRCIDPEAKLALIARGLPASPGAAFGRIVFDAERAVAVASDGQKVILVRPETTPDDIHGIIAAQGVLTSRGGMTSHAAVVARGMGKPCVCGCEVIKVDQTGKYFTIGEKHYHEGEMISLDGTTGKVIMGEVPLIEPELTVEFKKLLSWADSVRSLGIRANADTPADARRAVQLGAEGIGLCRTEHMFMLPERIPVVQRMILAVTPGEREQALDELLPLQISDFMGILREMVGLPVTIRLLDPPLHEFLPNRDELLLEVHRLRREAREGDRETLHRKGELLQKIRALGEANPMLGHRGCRLGLVYPDIYRMQVKAIFLAATALVEEGFAPDRIKLEIMIPLVGHPTELERMKMLVDEAVREVFPNRADCLPNYRIGTMIELPRACLVAESLAKTAQFFSFGTNDLTQTTLGYSRDDVEAKFLPFYLQQKILAVNPFVELDVEGVGELIRVACAGGRRARPEIKLGVCGEHGGDPISIAFFQGAGLDYVSCSPYRLPIARLAAAQATLRAGSDQR